MTDNQILAMYHGFPPEIMVYITEYVSKFHKPWPLYGPIEAELINYCIESNTSIDDLPEDDAVLNKYYKDKIF